jgi:hypothetical protein
MMPNVLVQLIHVTLILFANTICITRAFPLANNNVAGRQRLAAAAVRNTKHCQSPKRLWKTECQLLSRDSEMETEANLGSMPILSPKGIYIIKSEEQYK